MADQRISQLVALGAAGASANDVLPVADISASETKKITIEDLVTAGIAFIQPSTIDLAKLDQGSSTQLGTTALADASISTVKLQELSVTADKLATDSVTTSKLANSAVTYEKLSLVDDIIPGSKLITGSVLSDQIGNGAVETANLADGSVSTAKLQDASVTTSKLSANAVQTANLGIEVVNTLNLANQSVTYAKLQNTSGTDLLLGRATTGAGSVEEIACTAAGRSILAASSASTQRTALGLGSLAVSSGTWVDGSSFSGTSSGTNTGDQTITLTGAVLGSGTSTFETTFAPGGVTAAALAAGAVGTDALADAAVTTEKLNDLAVTTAKINDLAITSAKIANGAIPYSKLDIADGTIPGSKIADASITSLQLAPQTVPGAVLEDFSVSTLKIEDGAVTAPKLAANAVTTDSLTPSSVTTAKLATGSVTYDKIQSTAATNVLLGRHSEGPGTIEEIACSLQGRSLISAETASEQRDVLGLGDLATATGTWQAGSSFSGTSSGVNTGDQTITLTGAVTGSGTSTFATQLSADSVTSIAIATGAVTAGKLAAGAVSGDHMADNSTVVVSTTSPSNDGDFIGQHWFNSATNNLFLWDGTNWVEKPGLTSISFDTGSPITFSVTYPDGFTAEVSQTPNTQGVNTVWAGPSSGGDAAPTFRTLAAADLPSAATSSKGAILPGSGLTIPEDGTGTLNHSNAVTGATVSGITFDNEGHISAAVALAATDIPELDTSKIGTGQFSTDRYGDNSVTGAKLADYATAKLGESLPIADYIGQIFLNPLDKAFFMWDGNVWVPIGISAGEIVFGGTYNATTNLMTSVTSDGAAIGLTVGQALPSASFLNNTYYVVVAIGGTGTAPAPTVALQPPDILLSNGDSWVEIDVSSTYVAQDADNVAFTPAASIGSTTVQAALEEVSTECRNASNLTSGTLAVARGGTGLTTYSKGNLLVGNASNVLAALGVGTNNQVLTADSAEPLGMKWSNPAAAGVSSVSSTTAALSVTNGTTTPSLALRSATTAVDGIVQLSDSTSTTSSVLAATSTAVKSAYDLAAAALPRAGGTITGTVLFGSTSALIFEGATDNEFETTITVADPTADRTLTFPDLTGTLAVVSQLNDGTY